VSASPGSPAGFPAGLAASWPDRLAAELSLLGVATVDSTQRLARRLLDRHFDEDETPGPFVVVAGEQTEGRGRQGRSWQSAAGRGLWASLALPVSESRLQELPMRVAVALAEAVNRELGTDACRLKWPNDLTLGHRKLGGLLVDAASRPDGRGWAVAGMGVNHGHAEEELPGPGSISLRAASGGRSLAPLERFVADAIEAVWRELRAGESDWLTRYRRLTAHRPGDALGCDLAGERLVGRFSDFDARGFLVLETPAGPRTVRSGEVFAW
jgi:BirA family biotin operon repressor/biotin-[acetyl-CoA-carboxylase] ligase